MYACTPGTADVSNVGQDGRIIRVSDSDHPLVDGSGVGRGSDCPVNAATSGTPHSSPPPAEGRLTHTWCTCIREAGVLVTPFSTGNSLLDLGLWAWAFIIQRGRVSSLSLANSCHQSCSCHPHIPNSRITSPEWALIYCALTPFTHETGKSPK